MRDDDLELRVRQLAEASSGIRATGHLHDLLVDLDRREPPAVAAPRRWRGFAFLAPDRRRFASRLVASAAAVGIVAAVALGPLLFAGPKTGRETPTARTESGMPTATASPLPTASPVALLNPFRFEQLGVRLGWAGAAAYGDAGYIILAGAAVGVPIADEAVWRSSDGLTWVRSAPFWPHGDTVEALVPAQGGYVAITRSGDGPEPVDRSVWTSIDGSVWSKRLSLPRAVGAQLLEFRNRPLVLAGKLDGSSSVWSSDDLTTWSQVLSLPSNSWELSIAGDRVIAVGDPGPMTGRLLPLFVSTDGRKWTRASLAASLAAGTYTLSAPLRLTNGWKIQLHEYVPALEHFPVSFAPFHFYELTSDDLVTWQILDDWDVNGPDQLPEKYRSPQSPWPRTRIDGVEVRVHELPTIDPRTIGERGTGPANTGATIDQTINGSDWYGLQSVVGPWDKNLVTVQPGTPLVAGPHAVVLVMDFIEWHGGDVNNLSYYSELWVAQR